MKKLHRVVLVTAALSLVLGSALAAVSEAQPGPRGRRNVDEDAAAITPRGPARLDLTDEQKNELNEMRTEHRKQAVLRRGEMASLRAQLRAEFMNDEIDEGRIRSLSKKISDLRGQADEARLDHRLAMRNLLTDEQREQLQKMRMNGPGRGFGGPGFHRGFQGRGGRGGPGFHGGHGGRGMCGGPGFHGGHGGRGMRGGPGFHKGRGGRGMRGGPGFHKGRGGPGFGDGPGGPGPRGEGFRGPRGAWEDCPLGHDGGRRGGFFGDADPECGFGPWWMDPDVDGGPEAPPAPEEETEEIY